MSLMAVSGVISGAGQAAEKGLQTIQAGMTQRMLLDERYKLEGELQSRNQEFLKGMQENTQDFQRDLQKGTQEFQRGLQQERVGADVVLHTQDQQSRERINKETIQAQQDAVKLKQDLENKAPSEVVATDMKKIELRNQQRLEKLRNTYHTAKTPEAKKVLADEISVLTGKDNDNFIPVPVTFDEMTGKPIGYVKLNKKTGEVFTLKVGDSTVPPPKIVDPDQAQPVKKPPQAQDVRRGDSPPMNTQSGVGNSDSTWWPAGRQ